MFSGLGPETMDGGIGTDVIDHTAFGGDYVFNMATGLTNFLGESYTHFENATMGGGNDTVTGNASMSARSATRGAGPPLPTSVATTPVTATFSRTS